MALPVPHVYEQFGVDAFALVVPKGAMVRIVPLQGMFHAAPKIWDTTTVWRYYEINNETMFLDLRDMKCSQIGAFGADGYVWQTDDKVLIDLAVLDNKEITPDNIQEYFEHDRLGFPKEMWEEILERGGCIKLNGEVVYGEG